MNTKQSGEGQRYLATARVCPRHDRSPPAISSGHRTSRARLSGDSVTIQSSGPQIQSTTRRFAFEEQDAPVIEAQQAIIDAAQTSLDPVILSIDVGPVRYKRVLQKLIQGEQTHRPTP